MITFSQLNIGDPIYVLEIVGTFKKSTNYYPGSIYSVSKVYDEPITPQQFTMPNNMRRKLVDIVISCDGEQKKLTVEDGKSIITDSAIGLTVATDKQQIINMVRNTYNDYKAKKEALVKYEQEMNKCEDILKQLEYPTEDKDNPKIIELQEQIEQLKQMLNNRVEEVS